MEGRVRRPSFLAGFRTGARRWAAANGVAGLTPTMRPPFRRGALLAQGGAISRRGELEAQMRSSRRIWERHGEAGFVGFVGALHQSPARLESWSWSSPPGSTIRFLHLKSEEATADIRQLIACPREVPVPLFFDEKGWLGDEAGFEVRR